MDAEMPSAQPFFDTSRNSQAMRRVEDAEELEGATGVPDSREPEAAPLPLPLPLPPTPPAPLPPAAARPPAPLAPAEEANAGPAPPTPAAPSSAGRRGGSGASRGMADALVKRLSRTGRATDARRAAASSSSSDSRRRVGAGEADAALAGAGAGAGEAGGPSPVAVAAAAADAVAVAGTAGVESVANAAGGALVPAANATARVEGTPPPPFSVRVHWQRPVWHPHRLLLFLIVRVAEVKGTRIH